MHEVFKEDSVCYEANGHGSLRHSLWLDSEEPASRMTKWSTRASRNKISLKKKKNGLATQNRQLVCFLYGSWRETKRRVQRVQTPQASKRWKLASIAPESQRSTASIPSGSSHHRQPPEDYLRSQVAKKSIQDEPQITYASWTFGLHLWV